MANPTSLREASLDDLIDEVKDLATVANKDQVQSVMRVIAKSAIEVSEQVERFNSSTAKLTRVLIVLNTVLAIATLVVAWATLRLG